MEVNFGGRKVWRIDSFRAFGESKFGEIIDQPISTNFAKFAVSHRQSFLPYGIHKYHHVISRVINNELQHKFTHNSCMNKIMHVVQYLYCM